ncbi:MAG: DUF1778 domain-containing protein [Deltaproteobacteria bacterium]|nr:DUF1778 domain-containing protein [Deltaproteobacteria bacterium]
MRSGEAKAKTERLEARVPASVKAVLAKAAAIQGQSLTDFVVGSAADAARRVIREMDVLELSERDQIAFVEAVSKPAAPNRALRAAAGRYRAKRV